MPDYKYDQYGNQYVRVAGGGGSGCGILFIVYLVWNAVNAVVTWLEGVFAQVAKVAQWIYNPPLAKGFSQSAEGLVGAWYWLTILKPFSLFLHLIGAFFQLLGFVCSSTADLATVLWRVGAGLTPYPNLNLVLALLLEVGAAGVLLFAVSHVIRSIKEIFELVDEFWGSQPVLYNRMGAALIAVRNGYLYSLPVPFVFWIGLKIWQWVFATA